MTTLRKLGLRGVRSYSASEEESIEFLHPLTIIVGANGAGKTSIIESLKFVTTGSLPPLSDGGKSFVHDPKLEGAALIKAQVKLSFNTADNKQVLAIRNFQLSQKKAKREFKGMEAVLSTKDDMGRESSVSHKCADMEKLVPQLMGVSPAVLENVIFCHQEDSLWPLSDAKTLKLKFDDIFAATRYTKALDAIQKLRKEKTSDIKVMEAELKALESNVEAAHKLEDDLEATKASIAKQTEESNRISDQIKEVEGKLGKLGLKQDDISKIQGEIAGLQAQMQFLLNEKKKANEAMKTDYSDSDEELKAIYANFRQTQQQLVKTIEEKSEKLRGIEASCTQSEAEMAKLNEDIGKLKAHEADYQRKKKDLADLSTRINISGAASNQPAELSAALQEAFNSKKAELAAAQDRNRKLDSSLESNISALKSQETEKDAQFKLKSADLQKLRDKRAAIQRELTELDQASRALQSISDQLKSAQAQLDALNRTHEPERDAMRKQIDSKTRAIQVNTQKMSVISGHRKQLASQAELLSQIKLRRTQLQNLTSHYQSFYETLRRELQDNNAFDAATFPRQLPSFEKLRDVFGEGDSASDDFHMERLEAQLKKKQLAVKSDSRAKAEQVSTSTASVSALQSQRKSAEEQLQSLKKKLAGYRDSFAQADLEALFGGSAAQLEEEISKANKIFDKASSEQMLGSSAKLMYKRFLGIAKEAHKCYLCNREFADAAEENAFVTSNTDKMEKLVSADKAEKHKAATKAAKQKLEQVQALMPVFLSAQQLQQSDIPKLESQLTQLQADIASANSKKSALEMELKTMKDTEESLVELIKNTGGALRLFTEVQQMYTALRASEKKLEAEAVVDASSGKVLNLEQLTNEYEALEKLNMTLQRESNALQEKLEASRAELNKVQNQVNEFTSQKAKMTKIEADRENLKKAEQECLASYDSCKREAQALRDSLAPVKQKISESIAEREESRQRSQQEERRLSDSVSTMQREVDQFKALFNDVTRFEREQKDREEMRQHMQAKHAGLESMRNQRVELKKEITADQERAGQNDKIDADIKANLEYRERERAIVSHQRKIDEQTVKLREISGGELLDDLRHLQSRLVKLKEKRSEMKGSMNTEAKQADDLIENLTSERYRHIDKRYKTKLIEVKTNSLANQDLETYYRALDKALMHFHSIKMKEINETLKDYWRSVYKGSDIDEISIASDGAVVGVGRRNYNYRVVMKQGDTELDMRGRCSAGQKVLASLLIRLALADTFCSMCAVLALDEPTTNLDHKNITAFAQALNQIIEKRRDQSNFQLIVITHDETFVDEIGKRSHAEYYYRVYKDNAQHSKIRKQIIEQEEEH